MFRTPVLSALVLALALAPATATSAQEPARLLGERRIDEQPTLMVLGTAHLANYTNDVLTTRVDGVLQPGKQAEIEAVVDALARWRPTRIAVEVSWRDQADLDRRYADYRAGRYVLTADEVDQIGLRLANRLGLDRVDAVDWNEMPPGEEADYDWEVGAAAAGEQDRMAQLRDPARGRRATDLVSSRPVAEWLAVMNSPDYLRALNAPYYDYALLGTSDSPQGANWVGAWHGRNLKIFANLVRLADRPGDRVLVIYGAGHAFMLNRFAGESGAFRLESPTPWLETASTHATRPDGP